MIFEWIMIVLSTLIIVLTHDIVLKWISNKCNRLRMIWVMLILSMSHLLHIWIYAFSTYVLVHGVHVGHIIGCECQSFSDYIYFAASNYTSLGYGDFLPADGIRMISTMQGLIGLLMIGWSTAFAFWWMQRHWLGQDGKNNQNK